MLQPQKLEKRGGGRGELGKGWSMMKMGGISRASFRSCLWGNISRWELSAFFAGGANPEDGMLWKVLKVVGKVPVDKQMRMNLPKSRPIWGGKQRLNMYPKQHLTETWASLNNFLLSLFSLTVWRLIPKWAIFLEGIKGSGWKKGLAFSLRISPFCSWQRVKSPFWIFLLSLCLQLSVWGTHHPTPKARPVTESK